MNQNILLRAIAELQKKDFRKDYVLGMLETLAELSEGAVAITTTKVLPRISEQEGKPRDDAAILDAKARANIEQVKAMSKASTE